MAAENKPMVPVRFFGKMEDGSPCLMFDKYLADEILAEKEWLVNRMDFITKNMQRVYIGTEKPIGAPWGSIFLKTSEDPKDPANAASTTDLTYTPYYINDSGDIRKMVLATE